MEENVSKKEYEVRNQLVDERFTRDKERIEKLEDMCADLQNLSTQMGALLKKYDEQLEEQKASIREIEKKPGKHWDKLISSILAAIGSAIGSAILTAMILSPEF